MSYSETAGTAARRTRSTIPAALVVIGAALIGSLVYQLRASPTSSTVSSTDILHGDHHRGGDSRGDGEPIAPPPGRPPPVGAGKSPGVRLAQTVSGRRLEGDQRRRGAAGEADGAVPDGVTVFDDDIAAVANLDPDLLGALRRAAADAADDGVQFFVTSGWRSPAYQELLRREAVATYGSEKEASRWVASADTSAHVSGDAVDIGPLDAAAWLSKHGAKYGLCQIYRNEPWHYELRPEAIQRGCPPMYADPTHDPRMRR